MGITIDYTIEFDSLEQELILQFNRMLILLKLVTILMGQYIFQCFTTLWIMLYLMSIHRNYRQFCHQISYRQKTPWMIIAIVG